MTRYEMTRTVHETRELLSKVKHQQMIKGEYAHPRTGEISYVDMGELLQRLKQMEHALAYGIDLK